MHIGIITWFDYENYGTKLQAFALQRYLRDLGHKVELVNFRLNDSEISPANDTRSLQEKVRDKIGYLALHTSMRWYRYDFVARSTFFRELIASTCVLTQPITNERDYINFCNEFDALIFGSDQIWNPNWFHKFYYADYDDIVTPRIAYAPSLGVKAVPPNRVNDYIRCLSRFKALSLREQSACDCIHQITGLATNLVVDPTMLISPAAWSAFAGSGKSDKPYVLCYLLSDNINHWRAVHHYAREHHVRLKIIPQTGFSYWQPGEIERSAGVEDFVRLIRDAEYVITDSFHASVFSILFNKPFTVFERFSPTNPKAQNTRIYNLLELAGLIGNLQTFNSTRIICSEQSTANNVRDSHLMRLITESKHYLDSALNA